MSEHKAFGAFVLQAAKAGIDTAVAVAVYVKKRGDLPSDVRDRVEAAAKAGEIAEGRAAVLLAAVDKCVAAHSDYGKYVDYRDPKDWTDLGNGARMRKVHKDADAEMSAHVRNASAYRRSLGLVRD